ncbi:MAG: glycoside hydrolase family 25 protein [Oscillospiraceae bacterium]|nr:glycoside hydrolase family 25 protein [Oscillospiraceae bacterium]
MSKIKIFLWRLTTKQKIALISLILAFILFIVLIVVIINVVFSESKPVAVEYEPEICEIVDEYNTNAAHHSYDLKNIVDKNGFKYYYDNSGIKKSELGIDVSYAQKEIDWQKVKEAGIEFAMIRLGYRGYETGILHTDEYFEKNVKGASDAGIGVGIYFFSQAVNVKEARKEAIYIIDKIKDKNITYPVVFDWEVITEAPARTDSIAGTTLSQCALEFCSLIEGAGYKPMIYASLNLLREKYDKYDIDMISKYDLWLAEYKDLPEYPYEFKMWQYTNEGKIDGIDFDTDLNVYFKEVPDEE